MVVSSLIWYDLIWFMWCTHQNGTESESEQKRNMYVRSSVGHASTVLLFRHWPLWWATFIFIFTSSVVVVAAAVLSDVAFYTVVFFSFLSFKIGIQRNCDENWIMTLKERRTKNNLPKKLLLLTKTKIDEWKKHKAFWKKWEANNGILWRRRRKLRW